MMDQISVGNIAPSMQELVVVFVHQHKTLKLRDIVVMIEAPDSKNWLLRPYDMTLHELWDDSEQYVHVVVVDK